MDDANAQLGLTLKDYHSTMGRLLARGMRASLMADLSLEFLDQLIANFVSVIEPVIIVVLGIGVALIVIAILLPMYNMSNAVSFIPHVLSRFAG